MWCMAVSKKCIAGSIWYRMTRLRVWDVCKLGEKKAESRKPLLHSTPVGHRGLNCQAVRCSAHFSAAEWKFYDLFFVGLGSSPRLEIPTGRTNRLETMRTAWALSCRPHHSEGVREAGLTHTVSEIVREWMEADLISVKWNCSIASFALALID